jgi:hypothetical protein
VAEELGERIKALAKKRPQDYAEQTYASPYWLVRYPHRKRFSKATELLLSGRPRVLFDYGAGDGEWIARLLESPGADSIALAVAYDPTPRQLIRARERLASYGDRVRVSGDLAEAERSLGGQAIDAIACLGVLEHLSLRERHRFYRFCAEHLSSGGACVMDVPVEIGPTLLVKQFGRRVLKGWPKGYTLSELIKPVLGFRVRDPERFDPDREDGWIQAHIGFDYREMRDELAQWMTIERSVPTPMKTLPPWLFNQEVLIVARGRGAAANS